MDIKQAVIALLATVPASLASAGTITAYTDLTAFAAAVGPTVVEDFGARRAVSIPTGVLNSDTNLPTIIVPGDIVDGVTFSTPIDIGTFNIDNGAGFTGSFLDRLSSRAPLTIAFDVAQGAFGFVTNNLMSPFNIEILFSDGGSTMLSETPVGPSMSFFGYASSEQDIVGAVIVNTGLSNFAFAIDDFRFTTQSGGGDGGVTDPPPIPLPATALMLIAGLAGLGAIRARRG
jgi:hypothetical protein